MQHEINDLSVFVGIGGSYHEYLTTSKEDNDAIYDKLVADMTKLADSNGTFLHTAPNGVTSIIKLAPGMAIQVMRGDVLRRFISEQRQLAMLQQSQGAPRLIRQ